MKTFYTFTVGGEEYKMRLTASAIMAIEKKLGKSLFAALEQIQDNLVETVITIIWGAMQPLNANFPFEKAAGLFDGYIDDGHSVEDLMREINALFEASGFFKKGQE
ncbi:MAG TPA: hypothetical protein DEB31_10200 [Clostridiales bacterium]|nr:hypothetical protein [Clostridiales bacterium]